MEKEEFVPEYVYDIFKSLFENNLRPNCVRTKNITNEGLNQLITKGNLIWSNSVYDTKHQYVEGTIRWSKHEILIFFQKNKNEMTYKINILSDNLSKIDILLVGLNKYFTIDSI